jgi:FkbM family methyltransferase
MPANSRFRKVFKRALFPLIPESGYAFFQALGKALDISRGSWYEPELDLIPYALHPGESALDVGANFGLYSYHLSRAVAPSGRVYAFEPVPFTSTTLAMVARLLRFRNVVLVPKGCGDHAGTITFTVPVQEAGSLSAGQAYVAGRVDDRPGKEEQVRWNATRDLRAEVVVLDSFLPECPNLSLIKCDVEGFELPVFRGARRLIERDHPTVICEIVPWFLEGFNFALSELVGFFTDRGYALFRYVGERDQGRLKTVRMDEIVEDNYVFIHPRWLSRFLPLLEPKTAESALDGHVL